MYQSITTLVLFLLLHQPVFAQQPVSIIKGNNFKKERLIAGLALPLASFSETHVGGTTISYIRLSVPRQSREIYHQKKTGWLGAASFSHYLGKKEDTGLAFYRYKGYTLLEMNAGAAWYPINKLDLTLRAGPAIGYYNKILHFSLTGHLQGSYRAGPKTIITPGIALIKETGSDAIWVTSLQVGRLF